MKRFVSLFAITLAFFVAVAAGIPDHEESDGRLKVFILAGQSNMEGYGSELSLGHMADDPATEPAFQRLVSVDGFLERDDVWARYGPRKGILALGYGAFENGPPRDGRLFGPEYGFGMVMGDLFEEQVLLIKCCWGGASLGRQPDALGVRKNDFYPPGAGGDAETGPRYRQLVANVRATLKHLPRHFPVYDGAGYEIAGLVWFQGYSDQFGGRHQEYELNLTHLIHDLRRDLGVPDLPVVIGELGTGGQTVPPGSPETVIRKAQAAVAASPEFRGTVTFVPTACLTDPLAERLYRDQAWTIDPDRYHAVLSNKPIHYFGSGKMMFQMGDAFGRAMEGLLTR
jgi:hypothetical protein